MAAGRSKPRRENGCVALAAGEEIVGERGGEAEPFLGAVGAEIADARRAEVARSRRRSGRAPAKRIEPAGGARSPAAQATSSS